MKTWPFGPVQPDDDPIDVDGHGTAVASIVNGVAPGVSLYAVKVCSAVESACNGMAIVQGLEYAVDPNGDGDMSVSVIDGHIVVFDFRNIRQASLLLHKLPTFSFRMLST